MQDDNKPMRTFLNRRDWGSYLSALQNATTYPKVMEAVKSSRDWFAQSATHASSWLASNWLPESTHGPDKLSIG